MYFRSTILSFSLGLILVSSTTFKADALLPREMPPVLSIISAASADTSDGRPEPAAYSISDIGHILQQRLAARIVLGQSAQGRSIEAWYFPGSSDKRALVIGGVHGSELSSIEVATALLDKLLLGERPYYSVIIIPSLFPDNAAAAMNEIEQAGSVLNIGRYSHSAAVDPNRQMPSPGKAFDERTALDHIGRPIENENRFLLQLIEQFHPSRIANLHAIRNTGYGGIYADPRTDAKGIALGYDTDSSLAINMARFVKENGGNVNGNHLDKYPNALYYKDPVPAAKGKWQKRNMTGSFVNAHRGAGVSLGTWGTTAVTGETDSNKIRNAMRVLTLEFPGAKRVSDYHSDGLQQQTQLQLNAFTESIYHIFLGEYFTEESDPES